MSKVKKGEKPKFPTTKWKTKSVGNVRKMICENSEPGGKYWRNSLCDNWETVGHDAVSVVCHRCIASMTEPPKMKAVVEKSDKPKGWKFMKEFVSEDGTVYHKGVEQPALFGTLEPTVIEEKPAKIKLSKKEKEEMKNSLGEEIGKLKAKLMSETRKTVRAQLTKDLNAANRKLKKLI
jgi:hypothetical protein